MTVRRRRLVCTVTTLAGGGLLRTAMAAEPGSSRFYRRCLAVAAVWVAGAAGAGPPPARHPPPLPGPARRVEATVLPATLLGTGAFAAFYAGALVALRIPPLKRAVSAIVASADGGVTPLLLLTTLATGAAEEAFFRGAVHTAADGCHPVAVSTAAYTAANGCTGNPALALASVAIGTLCGRQRQATGGVLAPTLTHLTWSVLMLWKVAPLFRR